MAAAMGGATTVATGAGTTASRSIPDSRRPSEGGGNLSQKGLRP
jgi:hypothetical protein